MYMNMNTYTIVQKLDYLIFFFFFKELVLLFSKDALKMKVKRFIV